MTRTLTIPIVLALALAVASGCNEKPEARGGPGAGAACMPSLDSFESALWKPILSTRCLGCHNEKGAAKASRLVLALPAEADYLKRNLETLAKVAAIEEDGSSVLLTRPSNTHSKGHPGGALARPGSADYATLQRFVGQISGSESCSEPTPGTCGPQVFGPRTLRRLTGAEYDNTVADLLGVSSAYGKDFVADTVVHGFANNASALTVSPLLADQLHAAAEALAKKAVSERLSAISPCDGSADARGCAAKFINQLGERAFRRPVEIDELTRYMKVFDASASAGFADGIEAVVSAMLQSPFFLYRSELGVPVPDKKGVYQLSGYEIASELSYLIWQSMPDDALLAAARRGDLVTAAGVAVEARRMLASPRAAPSIEQFVIAWLGVDRVRSTPKDATIFPGFDQNVRQAMLEQVRQFVRYVLQQGDGTFKELLTARYSVVDDSLATFYGIAAPGTKNADGFGKVDSADASGLLTLGAVLATYASPDASSPIHRGVLVRERLLCEDLPPPPANISVEPPGLDPKLTTRERYAQHSTDAACRGCHELIDPIGFGFERFDGVGRPRADENGHSIDTHGSIHGTNVTFDGVAQLGAHLAQDKQARRCFTMQWLRWSYGQEGGAARECLLDNLVAAFDKAAAAGSPSVEALIVALTQTDHFRLRSGPEGGSGPGAAPSGGDAGPGPAPDGGGGGDGGSVAPGASQTSPGITVDVVTDSQWDTGYCNKVNVKNTSSAPVDWVVRLQPQGTINQHWSANKRDEGGAVIFDGLDWNNVLQPGQSTSFGFCATL